jgi:hypothetical protein
MMVDDQLPFDMFLCHLSEILSVYLEILEKKPYKEDHSRYISKVD